MQPAQRAIVNTSAQYVRTIINILLSLYSTRLVLDALGKGDFGIFQLVGGVVAMLGFLTNALVITTQRHLSYAHGRGDKDELRRVFANSLMLHLILGGFLVLILALSTPWIIGFLEIDSGRIETAQKVFLITLATLFLSFLVAPFRALFIARENIIYISCIDVLDGVLKVAFVVLFLSLFPDRLLTYALLISSLMLFNLCAFSIYARIHYGETTLCPSRKELSYPIMRRIVGFAGWTTYSMGCIIARNQGTAVVLNKVFLNTLINAAYGIALQINGAAIFVSQAIINALSPQIIKAEGGGDRRRMLELAEHTSKYAFLLLLMATAPLIAEMDQVLDFWLGSGRYPAETPLFCRVILIAAICDQLTIGLGVANQAIGKIRNYSLVINTIKVLTLPVLLFLLWSDVPLNVTMWAYAAIEFVGAMIRLPFLHFTAGLSIPKFLRNVFLSVSVPCLTIMAVCVLMTHVGLFPFRFLVTLAASALAGGLATWFWSCGASERATILSFIHK